MFNMNDLFIKYDKRLTEIRHTKERIKKLELKLNALWDKSGWIDMIVKPLAKELAKAKNMHYQIYGPFGLGCRTTIYLTKQKGTSIVNNDTYSLTVTPNYKNGTIRLNCVQNHDYKQNTIDLPDNLDDIIGLLEFNKVESQEE